MGPISLYGCSHWFGAYEKRMRPSPGTKTVRQLRHGPVSFSVATEIDNSCPRLSILVSLMRRVTSSGIGNTLNVDNCFSPHFSLRLKSIVSLGAKRIYPFLAFKLFSTFLHRRGNLLSLALCEQPSFFMKRRNSVNLWSQLLPKGLIDG